MVYLLSFILSLFLVSLFTFYLKKHSFKKIGLISLYIAIFFTCLIFLGPTSKVLTIILGVTPVVFGALLKEHRGLFWAGQLLGTLILFLGGIKIDFIAHPFKGYIYLNPYSSFLLTFLWLIFMTKIIMLTNRLDGLTLTLAYIISLTFFATTLLQASSHLKFAATLSLIIAGSCLGFLPNNFYPAKIKIGQAEGAFLGFILATLSILSVSKKVAFIILLIPLSIVCVPLILVISSILHAYLSGSSFKIKPAHKLLIFKMNTLSMVLFISFICLNLSLIVCALMVGLYQISIILFLSLSITFLLLGKRFLFKEEEDISFPRQIKILGVRIDGVGMEEAVRAIEEFIEQGEPHQVITPNSSMVLCARQDRELAQILNRSSLSVPDGIGLLWAAEFYGTPIKERVTGIDLMKHLCLAASKKGYSLYLLGAKEDVARRAKDHLLATHSHLKVVGHHQGFFDKEEEKEIISEIREKRPDILFVGMGAINQEKWIAKHLKELRVPVCIGVGGSFDVVSGRLKRAPLWVMNRGFEWLYRLLIQPWRILRITALPSFVFTVFVDKITLNDEE